MTIQILQFIAILLTAAALIPGGAHLLEIANKISLDQEHYLIVQQIYRGWALLGVIIVAAIIANAIMAFMMQIQTTPMVCAATAALLLCITLGIFFIWTYPANQATSNWTMIPENWQVLRQQWEYSHVTNAIVTFLALCSTTAASLTWAR